MFDLSICVEPLFENLRLDQRVKEVNQRGFLAEFWQWGNYPAEAIDAIAADPDSRISIFGGSTDGSMVHPDYTDAYVDGLEKSAAVAKKLRCKKLSITTGYHGPKGEVIHPIAQHPATLWATAYKTLCRVAEIAERFDLTICLESLNTKVDHAGYPIPRVEDAARLVEAVGSPRVRMLCDIYHVQVEEGNVIQNLRDYGDFIAHVHVADVPGRHEPGTGEINYPRVIQALRDINYQGAIGLEAWPEGDDLQALDRFRELFG